MDVRPGVDPAVAARRLDQLIAEFIAKGPTADEVARVATREVAGRINGLSRSAASAARRSRWRKARSMPTIPTSTRSSSPRWRG
jgi:hypothetical protein